MFRVNDRVRYNPGYGADWTGTVVEVTGDNVLVLWDGSQGALWNDQSEIARL